MSKYKKQSHVVWKCDYHIVWTPKYRFRVLTGLVKDLVEHDIRMLTEWKGCEVIELNAQADHVYLVVSTPPKVSVSTLMAVRRCGILKGKLAIKLFKSYPQLNRTAEAEETLLGQPSLRRPGSGHGGILLTLLA